MSLITAELLEEEVRRLYAADNPHVDVPEIAVSALEPEEVEFDIVIGGRRVTVPIPAEELHNAPLSVVSMLYLKPIVERCGAPI